VLQQEVRSQDQFAQLHTAISESRGLNGPHKDFVKLIWEDGPNGRVAGLERTTAGRKSHEKIKINQKVLPFKTIKSAVYPSLIELRLLVGLDQLDWVRSFSLHDPR